MARTERIETNCHGIVVELDLIDGGGAITSDLLDDDPGAPDSRAISAIERFHAAMSAIESIVLAHACAGVDIKSPAYIEGIEVAVEACENRL